MTTANQIQTAHALAKAFGHAWGELDVSFAHFENVSDEWASEAMWMAVKARCPQWPGLIPVWDADGDIAHTSGTQRISWVVDRGGNARINVWRPGDELAATARVEFGGKLIELETYSCRMRHWDALAQALTALGCTAPIPGSVLRAEARDLAETMLNLAQSLTVLVKAGGGPALNDALADYGPPSPEVIAALAMFEVQSWAPTTEASPKSWQMPTPNGRTPESATSASLPDTARKPSFS